MDPSKLPQRQTEQESKKRHLEAEPERKGVEQPRLTDYNEFLKGSSSDTKPASIYRNSIAPYDKGPSQTRPRGIVADCFSNCAYDCPIYGCQQKFKTEENLDDHLRESKGKAHKRYRKAKNIAGKEERRITKIDEVSRDIEESCAPIISKYTSTRQVYHFQMPVSYYGDLSGENSSDDSEGSSEDDEFESSSCQEGDGSQIINVCPPCEYFDNLALQTEDSWISDETDRLYELAWKRIRARKKHRKAAARRSKPSEEEPPKKKAKICSTATATSPDEGAPKKRCAFAILMKSGGVAKKNTTPKKKVRVEVPLVTPPPKPQNDETPVVETVYAYYSKRAGDCIGYKVVGFKFHYSDFFTKKFGQTTGAKKSKSMHLFEKEYITAIEIHRFGYENYDGNILCVDFYTSHWSGRKVSFEWKFEDTLEDPFCDVGNQGCEGDFHVKNGRMITGVSMSKGEITGIVEEKVPKSGNHNRKANWR